VKVSKALSFVIRYPHRYIYTYFANVLMQIHRMTASVTSSDWAERLCYKWLAVSRPHYAYGISKAAQLAQRLGQPGFTVVEFGVAGGSGLVAMERHAAFYSRTTGLEIDVVGFDSGTGMPDPIDYRDADFTWTKGQFAMDEAKLRQVLGRAHLVLGEVSETIRDYQPRLPIGFISFDLDYYSSTMAALSVVEGEHWNNWMPRVSAYFDDVSTVEWIGERLAIRDWNVSQSDRKVGQNPEIRDSIPGFPRWALRIFEIHLFSHPQYRVRVADEHFQQLPLNT
jgi:hypothetical protein